MVGDKWIILELSIFMLDIVCQFAMNSIAMRTSFCRILESINSVMRCEVLSISHFSHKSPDQCLASTNHIPEVRRGNYMEAGLILTGSRSPRLLVLSNSDYFSHLSFIAFAH